MFPPHFRHICFSFTSWPFLVTSICYRALSYRRDSFILAIIYGIYLVFGIFSQRLIRPPLWYNLMHSYDGCSLIWLAPEYITYLIILPWNPFRRWLDRVWPALWTICYAWPLISSLKIAMIMHEYGNDPKTFVYWPWQHAPNSLHSLPKTTTGEVAFTRHTVCKKMLQLHASCWMV